MSSWGSEAAAIIRRGEGDGVERAGLVTGIICSWFRGGGGDSRLGGSVVGVENLVSSCGDGGVVGVG